MTSSHVPPDSLQERPENPMGHGSWEIVSRSPYLGCRAGHVARKPGPSLEPQSGHLAKAQAFPSLSPGCWHLQAPMTERGGRNV